MRKKILSILSILTFSFIILLSSCTSSNGDNSNNNSKETETNKSHEHSYASSYSYDDQGHWYKSTCEHDLKKDYSLHSYTEWTITKVATETSEGEKTRTCSVCGYSQSESIEKLAHTHTYSTTYEHGGNKHWHPSTCGHQVKSYEEAHKYGEWIIMKNPTVSSEGQKARTCSVCGYIQTEIIKQIDGYSTTWKDYDGTVLKVEYSDTLLPSSAYKEELSRDSDQVYKYTFTGFKQEIISAKEIEYIATYSKSYVLYTINFLNYDDSVILSEQYHYGEEVTCPNDPQRNDSDEFVYTFVGWDKTVALVTGDATYKALYSSTTATYNVTFKNDDGTILKSETLKYGETPTAPSNPTKDKNETYTYTFLGWTPEVNAVTGNVVYTATYSQTLNKYNITFVSNGGTYIGTKELECTTVINEKPEYENKTFLGWYDSNDNKVTTVPTSDITLYAKWIDYDINFTYKAITAISANETLDKEHFSIVATDTDGDNLDVDISIINGNFESGMTITVRIVVSGKYDNKISKTISEIKVYGNPTLTYTLDKKEVNLSDVNLNLFNASAIDSFGNELTVNYKPYNDTLSGGKTLSFVLYTTDEVGNLTKVITNPIKIYSSDDINLNYSITKNIKSTSNGEEFNANATNSFNETLDIKLVAAQGYTIEAGKTINLYITATDKLGNVKQSELIENVKIYGDISIKYIGTNEYLTPTDNLYNLYEVKDSFDELYYDINIISGGMDQNEIVFNVKAKDKANNILDETYHFYVLEDDESLVYMYENDELCGKTVIKNGQTYTLNKKYENVGATWYMNNIQFTDESAKSLDIWNNTEKICSAYTYYYQISFDLKGGSIESNPQIVNYGSTYVLLNPLKVGYTFVSWEFNNKMFENGTYKYRNDITISANWNPSTDTRYTVNHYLENSNDDNYTLESTDNLTGTTATIVTPTINTYDHYTSPSKQSLTINSDGSSVLNYYYKIDHVILNVCMNNGTYKNVDMKYGQLILSISNQIIWDGFTYDSMYYDDELTNEVNLNDTISSDKSVYIYWKEEIKPADFKELFKYSISEMKVIITDYIGTNNIVVIPFYYKNNSVTSIGSSAFECCISLTSITIPNSVTSIGTDAFDDCGSLVEIINKSSLNITKGDSKYGYISALNIKTSGTSDIVNINDYLFYTYNNVNYLIKYVGDDTLVLPSDYNGESYEIYNHAFHYNRKITSVIIPDSVTSIGSYAFAACKNLTNVTIPDSVTSIGTGAFLYSDSLKYNNEYDNAYYLGNEANPYVALIKAKSTDITSCSINDNCKFILSLAFESCINLISITIPNSVTGINGAAFSGCLYLVEVINKSSLNITKGSLDYGFIGFEALKIKTSGTSDIVNKDGYLFLTSIEDGTNYLIKYVGDDTSLVLPSDYNGESYDIYSYAFSDNSKIISVTIPDSVTSIGTNAFNFLQSLVEIINKSSLNITKGDSEYGCINALNIKTSGTSDIVNKDGYLFLTSIEDGTNYLIKYVGDDTSLVLPSDYNGESYDIYSYAFSDNSKITSVIIPDSVTIIGYCAFAACKNLTNVTIPDSVTSIGTHAFLNCISLKYNEYNNAYYLGNDTNPYVALIEAKSTDITSCSINDNCKLIFDRAFIGCRSLTSITIPDSVTSIGFYVFCSSLTTIVISGVTSLGYQYSDFNPAVYFFGDYDEFINGNNYSWFELMRTYFYSEEQPSDTTNKYWHYVNGIITIW